jgi:hypothetical protein
MAASPGFRDVAKVTSIAVRMSCACDGAYRKVAFKDLPAHLPQRQPQGIRRPAGRPRLTFEFLLRGSPCSEPAGRFGHMVKCPLAVSRTPQPQPHFIRGPAGRPRLTFKAPRRRASSTLHVGGCCRPLRAIGEVRAHIAPSELFAATPTAFHPPAAGVHASPPSSYLGGQAQSPEPSEGMGAGDLACAAVCADRAKVRT